MFFSRKRNQSAAKPRRAHLTVEQLETRLLPATLVSPTVVAYKDWDGDMVKVTSTKPVLDLNMFQFEQSGVGENLVRVNLSGLDQANNGLGLNIKVTRMGNHGDGLVNVGQIEASGLDLGKVTVAGDLGGIDAHNLANLAVQSLGGFATTRRVDTPSNVAGTLTKLTVTGNMGGDLTVAGNIGSATIGGLLWTSTISAETISRLTVTSDMMGQIVSSGDMGPINIGAEVGGGNESNSGSIYCGGNLGSVSVGGSLVGGDGMYSGSIQSQGNMGKVTIGGDLIGGAGIASGYIRSVGIMGKVTIGGDLKGGAGFTSGYITTDGLFFESGGARASITVGGSVIGGDGFNSGVVAGIWRTFTVRGSVIGGGGESSGQIQVWCSDTTALTIYGDVAGGAGMNSGYLSLPFGSITIGGNLRGGNNDGSGKIFAGSLNSITIGSLIAADSASAYSYSGAILAESIGSLQINANIAGNAVNRPLIHVRENIGSVIVNGNVDFADIFVGADVFQGGTIGAVRVGGHWTASNLAAGVDLGIDGLFGTDDDVVLNVSKINKIAITGLADGTWGGDDLYGIMAKEIVSAKIAGAKIRLTSGPNNDSVDLGTTGDLVLQELAE